MNISRRNALSAMAMGALGIIHPVPLRSEVSKTISIFRYCLNTSTISSQNPVLLKYIEIA